MEQYEAFKKVREARAKGDLIGTIHNSEEIGRAHV